MSFCICGGYLGTGGVDAYSGRWCRCTNPIVAVVPLQTSTNLTIQNQVNEGLHLTLDKLKEGFKPKEEVKEARKLYGSIPLDEFEEVIKEIKLVGALSILIESHCEGELTISYNRLETDEEYIKRLKKEEKIKNKETKRKQLKEKKERELLAKLKEKYE